MRQPARPLDAAARGEPIGNDDPAECRRQSDDEDGAEAEQDCGVEETRQIRQEIEEPEHEKHTEHAERRPASRPHPLPHQRGTGEAQPRREQATGG